MKKGLHSAPKRPSVPSLRIVIVAWNASSELWKCIHCLSLGLDRVRANILIVDNGLNGSIEQIVKSSPLPVRVLSQGSNVGFGRACNVGAVGSTEDYLLFLNPDVFFDRGAVAKLLGVMTKDKKVAAIGPQLRSRDGKIWRSCAKLPTLVTSILSATGLEELSLFKYFGAAMSDFDHKRTASVEQLIGAAFMIRRAVFVDIGGFDESYFVYYEEVDLCLKLAKRRVPIIYEPKAKAVHLVSASSSKFLRKRSFYNRRSRCIYTIKHDSIGVTVLVVLSSVALELLVKVWLRILTANFKDAYAITQATYDLCVWLVRSKFGKIHSRNREI